ncbi:PAS domain-containing protein [Hymenobacter convexus]|uniref:PAS domain-containing protein n=1 Tax=Hymenobacter sp. CA1UV-4 TaxID=3063782 RepID=UPI002712D302|nr:PAS domain-containing protein [Hymenobacter sp. CA1UV-4]MDO7853876.1 PAS domain-containing protein [Hymenobacter sp. CA1UV-4]
MKASPPAPPDPSRPGAFLAPENFFDALPWGVLVLDEEHIIRQANPVMGRWCGVPVGELLDQPLAEARLPPALRAALLPLPEPGAAAPREVFLPGPPLWLAFAATRQPGGWVLHGHDITAQKQGEAALHAAEQQQAYFRRLRDALRPLQDPAEIQATAARLLGQQLAVDRAYYVEVDAAAREFVVARDWHRPGAPSHAGRYPLAGWHMPWLLNGQTWVAHDVDTDPNLPDEQRADYRARDIRAALVVPFVRHGQLVATLVANQNAPRAWTPHEVALVEATAERTWAAVLPARAEAALQEAHGRLVEVLESTHDAFYSLDANFCFTYVNQRAAQLWGRAAGTFIGHNCWQEFPQTVNSDTTRRYHEVLESGQPAHFETISPILGVWIEVSIYPSSGGGLAVFFRDIAGRKRAEERQAYLLQLSDALRPLQDPAEIQVAAVRVLGEHFGADRVQYWEAEADGEHFGALGGYARDGAPGPGRVRLDDFGPYLRAASAAAHEAAGARSYLAIPLVKEGKRVATLGVYRNRAHHWTAQEMALAEETAERTWAAVARGRAEEARHQSEQRLRAVMENLPGAAVFIVGPSLRYQLAEGEALRQAGYAPADFVGRSVQERCPPEFWPDYQQHYQQALAGRPFEHEHQLGGRTFATRGRPLYDAAGVVMGVLAVSYDITARKQAEEALRLSEQRLSLALQAGRMGSFEWTSDGHRVSLSAMSAEVLGLMPGTTIATSDEGAALLVHPDDRARHRAIFDEAARTGQDFHSIFRIVRPRDGEVRWIEERGQGTHDPATGGVRLRGVHWDVTETMLAQARLAGFNALLERRVARRTRDLQASRDLLQSMFDTNLIAMSVQEAVRDENGAIRDFRLRLVSRELARETGRPDLVGKFYAEEFPGVREAGIFDLAVKAVETGQPQGMEYFYQHKGFDKWFACQFVKLGDGVVATNLDITERKTAEQERMKNLRLLEQAEAVAGLGSWDYELATSTLRWSDGMYQLYRLPPGSAVAPADYLRMVLPDDQPVAARLVQRLSTGTGDFEKTLRLRVDGRVKTVRMKAVVARNAQGQAVRVLGVDLDISELQRLEYDNLRLRLRQQRVLFEAVQAAQEAERKRMAESLHNGIGQILYATKLHLDRLHAPLLGTDDTLVAARREADHLLGEAIRQTRALSHELVPLVLTEFGLPTALQDICRTMSSPPLRFRCLLQLDDRAAPLGPALQMALYRIAQELAQNIVRHARGATQASLELETMPGWALLRAEDNGAGFAAPAAEAPGLGLRSIRDRVALLGGQLEIGTASAGGAYVRIRIPSPVAAPITGKL